MANTTHTPKSRPTVLALSLAAAFAISPALAQTNTTSLPTGATAIHGTATLTTPQANKLVEHIYLGGRRVAQVVTP